MELKKHLVHSAIVWNPRKLSKRNTKRGKSEKIKRETHWRSEWELKRGKGIFFFFYSSYTKGAFVNGPFFKKWNIKSC